MFDHVQAALFFFGAGPSAGPFVAVSRWAGTRPAADARIVLVVEGIVGYIVLCDETPHFLPGPLQQRVDFDQAKLGVALHDAGTTALIGLVGADGADPGGITHNCSPQRQNLAIVAALVGTDGVQRPAVFFLIFR